MITSTKSVEKSVPELRFEGVFLPVSVAVTVLKTLTGQLRADISIIWSNSANPKREMPSSDDLRTTPYHRFYQEYGAHAILAQFLWTLYRMIFEKKVLS